MILLALWFFLAGQTQTVQTDSDGDGLTDQVEQRLLVQFAPTFMISRTDCSNVPAQFLSGTHIAQVESENSTIYGQVSPVKLAGALEPTVEIRYYHLWARDCGSHGHLLDAEHVSVLVKATETNVTSTSWKALFWFAAAHENTLCDVSQIARAATLKADDRGATIWISAGKHASFLDPTICRNGCGNDQCENVRPLAISQLVNMGEPGHPMNGSRWISSPQWPLVGKMKRTDFPPATLARLKTLPPDEIASFHPGRHPAQGVVAISSAVRRSSLGAFHALRTIGKN